MPAPSRRSVDDIAEDILNLLNPPEDKKAAVRAEVLDNIDRLKQFARRVRERPTPAKQKQLLKKYLAALNAAKQKKVPWWSPVERSEKEEQGAFAAKLDAEIERTKERLENLKVPPGARRLDMDAAAAVQQASLMVSDWVETRRLPKLTRGNCWHGVAGFLYEASTRRIDCEDLLHTYMRRFKNQRYPRIMRLG